MKKKLTILAFSLLLAVGWTNVAQAQLKSEPKLKSLTQEVMKPATDVSSPIVKWGLKSEFLNDDQRTETNSVSGESKLKTSVRAPKRENNTITADVALTRAQYEEFTYDWVDANNTLHRNVKITEPVTNAYQMAYLLGTTYMNPNIPGIQYTAVWDQAVGYSNVEFGWDLPGNTRWHDATPTEITYNDITISIPSWFIDFDYIYVQSNGVTVEGGSWSYAVNNTSLPSGWGGTVTLSAENNGCCTQSGGGTIVIPHSIIDGKENVTVVMSARKYQSSSSSVNCTVTIAGATPESNEYTTTDYAEKTWSINPQSGGGSLSGNYYGDLRIDLPSYNMTLYSITVANANGTTITSWDGTTAINNNQYASYTSNNNTYYAYTLPGWEYTHYFTYYSVNSTPYGYMAATNGGSIIIPGSLLDGTPRITVTIRAYSDTDGEVLSVNSVGKTVTTSLDTYTWTFQGTTETAARITPPYQNGYTVFLVKVDDNATNEPRYTSTWSDVIDYFDTHIDEVVLLTDGTRLNTDTEDAGTMYSYSGELNRFYFISKGKTYELYPFMNGDGLYDGAPTYSMYEEFSAHQPYSDAADITDFYSKLLYGNSYNVVHDCQGVNLLEHYFSMSGKTGDEHKSMTNLIFWIPDHRSKTNVRTYDEEYLPHVGLYTIWLEAEAERAANYSTSNRMYDVTLDWVSSLNTILDFDVDQDYELWVYIYDEQGNPIADYKVLDRLQMQDLLIHNETTFTYQVPQLATSQTIVYRVKGWPKDAPNNPAKGGDFFALSNLDPVLIPGYENFLSLGVEHYESDFALDVEHNYYRNFLTVDNENPDNALTANRIENGEGEYELYRYDVAKPTQMTKAADLLFTVGNNKVTYDITYANQDYVDEANVYNEYNNANLQGYTNPDNLGCPIHGEIANISEGGGAPVITDKYVKVTSSSDLTSGQYLIVYEIDGTSGVAFNGGLTTLDAGNNNIPVTIDNYTIPANSTTNAASFMIDVARGTVQSASGYYIGQNSASNGMLSSNTTYYTNTFSMNGTDGVIQGAGGYQLRFNSASGNDNYRFRYYASTSQKAIQLYKRVNTGSDATTNTDVTVGPTNSYATTYTYTVDGVTLSSGGDLGWGSYMRLNGTTTISTTEGTITKIVVIGSNTSYPVSRLTPASGTYAVANNVGIWTGNGASVSFTSTNAAYVTSLIVTVTKTGSGGGSSTDGYTLLNNFLDNSTYTQVGQVVFTLPWKSIQVKLQDTSAGTSSGYFMIQNGGKLRFVMPAGYNNANVKFVVHNAPASSNYYFGTFTLSSSTGDTQTITINEGSSTYADKDYEAIFMGISSGDVITITGTHTVDGTPYNYSPDFKYIHVYVQGGTGGIGKNDALNLDAIKFVDQFKAETKDDTHPYRYGYVLKAVGSNQESGRPEIPVLHTNSTVQGFYSLDEINDDVDAYVVDPVDVMNAEVNMTLSRDPEIYYYTLDRKPSTVSNAQWEAISKLQKREDDSYNEMLTDLPQYDDQVCNPPAVTTPPTPWIVDRFDNYDVKTGGYNSFMSYVPVIWTHGDQKNRRVKWNIENRHNSYGSPIWKTGVAKVELISATAERQNSASTNWTYGGDECSLYILDKVVADAKMPTVNNVNYVPYMFRLFVKSKNHKLRGYKYVAEGVDPNKPGEHYDGDVIDNDTLLCVWSGFVNDPHNADYGVTITSREENGATIYTFNKVKVDRTDPDGEWDKNKENAIFAGLEDIIQGEGENMTINKNDLTIMVRFYYLVDGFDASVPASMRGEGSDPAGYGVEGSGDPSPWTAITDVFYNATVESVTYVNTLGMTSDKPFDGVNIVITRYTNGRTITQKVVR